MAIYIGGVELGEYEKKLAAGGEQVQDQPNNTSGGNNNGGLTIGYGPIGGDRDDEIGRELQIRAFIVIASFAFVDIGLYTGSLGLGPKWFGTLSYIMFMVHGGHFNLLGFMTWGLLMDLSLVSVVAGVAVLCRTVYLAMFHRKAF